MNTNTALALEDSPATQSVAEPNLSHLSDDDLLANTRRLVGRSNQIFAALLVHLAEVEARGLHRLRACSSLYIYCVYELRLSEDAAYRRVSAARLVKRFPALLGAVERGELHLTGLLLLGPHLTPENHVEVLAHAKHRTKKEITKLVRLLDPVPDVPARIAPLGPAPARNAPERPTWEQFMLSLNPVRELTPGDRPRDWMVDAPENESLDAAELGPAPARVPSTDTVNVDSLEAANTSPAPARVVPTDATNTSPAPARVASPMEGPQRYQVQFTASEEYVELVERARALLSQVAPNLGIEGLHFRAMQALVAELEKRTCAVKPAKAAKTAQEAPPTNAQEAPPTNAQEAPREATPLARPEPNTTAQYSHQPPQERGRTIPAAVRRAVWSRDEARCTYVDSSTGQRCRETHHLELHHAIAFAHGGAHSASNLTLRCRAHNALAAETDFGREFIVQKWASRHESYRKQSPRNPT